VVKSFRISNVETKLIGRNLPRRKISSLVEKSSQQPRRLQNSLLLRLRRLFIYRSVDRIDLEARTRGQGCSEDWMAERRNRLTASNFHRMLTLKPTTPTQSLVHSMKYGSFSTVHTRFGTNNEDTARRVFCAVYQKTVTASGLVTHVDHPYLAASPGRYLYSNM